MKAYYARRAAEYDATSWEALDATERATVERFVASLPPVRIGLHGQKFMVAISHSITAGFDPVTDPGPRLPAIYQESPGLPGLGRTPAHSMPCRRRTGRTRRTQAQSTCINQAAS